MWVFFSKNKKKETKKRKKREERRDRKKDNQKDRKIGNMCTMSESWWES